jgi:hypothetical protein
VPVPLRSGDIGNSGSGINSYQLDTGHPAIPADPQQYRTFARVLAQVGRRLGDRQGQLLCPRRRKAKPAGHGHGGPAARCRRAHVRDAEPAHLVSSGRGQPLA